MSGIERIRSALPPNRVYSAGLLLFPFALAGGFLLMVRNTPPAPVHATIDCAKAIGIAREFLAREGADTPGWRSTCNMATESNWLAFSNSRPDQNAMWRIAPPIGVLVKFTAGGKAALAQVKLTVDGQVTGFSRSDDTAATQDSPGADGALKLATDHLPPGVAFGKPSLFEGGNGKREYTFRSTQIPGAHLSSVVKLEGSVVRSLDTEWSLDDSQPESKAETAQTLLSILGGIFACFVALYSIYRYATRTLQQEISHKRSLIVALFCGAFAVLLGMNAVVNSNEVNISSGVVLLVFAALGVICGAVVAAAYGSGEGDVREAFPGKLTSLDTLLTGRLFSFNTGASLLVGLACAGWLVLAMGILTMPFRTTQAFATQAISEPFLRLHWLMPFVSYPLFALGIVAAGLMQPVAFVQRNISKSHRWRMGILVVCSGLASLLRAHSHSTGEFLVSSAVSVVAVLAPFFLHDLLSTLICVTAIFSIRGLAVSLAAIPASAHRPLDIHAAIAGGLIVFAIAAVMRGKRYTEEQVRPLYAKHIAERKALEAEVSAAREAQLRLLPEKLPSLAGVYISAACVPAETVGGDFYDFFTLGDGRLGVFLAEGNNRGLAAALTIALAKGYLMQCVEKTREPVEILSRLEGMLGSIFGTGEAGNAALTEFAFASLDTARGELRYVRTGAYPKVAIASAGGSSALEREIAVKSRSLPITEGRATLAPGDHVVLFTDGIGRRLALGNRRPEDAAAELVLKTPESQRSGALGTDEVCHRFLEAAKGAVEPDDLTLVVIQMHALAQSESGGALEAVA
ncbi:MAG: SpoIIE family protein phosphatase [Acidobacteriota bacterium]|nr:SpoIIE family protein phosphatase [Acidobacteriota bacterium]